MIEGISHFHTLSYAPSVYILDYAACVTSSPPFLPSRTIFSICLLASTMRKAIHKKKGGSEERIRWAQQAGAIRVYDVVLYATLEPDIIVVGSRRRQGVERHEPGNRPTKHAIRALCHLESCTFLFPIPPPDRLCRAGEGIDVDAATLVGGPVSPASCIHSDPCRCSDPSSGLFWSTITWDCRYQLSSCGFCVQIEQLVCLARGLGQEQTLCRSVMVCKTV